MQIKSTQSENKLSGILLVGGLGLGLILLFIFSNNKITNQPTTSNPKTTADKYSSHPTNEQLKNITIEISKANYLKLEQKRNDAIGQDGIDPGAGILFSTDEDLVKAKIQYEGEDYKGKVRLKGDWTQHLLGDTWSFRIKLDDNQSIEGMRKFSLQHPQTRNYAGEWLFHELLKAEDILHLRYDFVNVTLKITGDLQDEVRVLGVYALEEFFDKRLIEHNRRREGVLLKFDEDPMWKERRHIMTQKMKLADLNHFKLARLETLDILPFGKNKVLTDSVLNKQFRTAKYLLESFIEKKLSISEVFDVERLAMFNAICNILGANHALYHHNYRFYYNPINSRLEPVGFDSDPINKVFFFQPYLHAFEDDEYSTAYMAALEKVSSDEYFEGFLNSPDLNQKIALLQKAYPEYAFHEDYLRSNKTVIRSLLFPQKSLNVFLERIDNNSLTLSIMNHGRYPAEILGISNVGNRRFGAPTNQMIIPPGQKEVVTMLLNPSHPYLFIKKKKQQNTFDLAKNLDKVKLNYKTPGTQRILSGTILPWAESDSSIMATDIFRQKSSVHHYPFLEVDSMANTITCKKGNWNVSYLVIPKGYTFIVNAGTNINLHSVFGNIISFSPVRFLGTKAEPISIFTNVGAKGLLVLNCQDTSIVQHTRFENLSAAQTEGWSVSGAVNFYDAPVKLYNCAFVNNRSEDALNIINTYFEMDNLIFQNIQSDAFDGDFVNGYIRNTFFSDIGNDAIDVSGSNITVTNTHISNAGDKGLSAGEKSIFKASDIVIRNCEIAVACKDQSTLYLSNALLEDNKLAFTAFQKKPEYGAATIEADSITLKGNALIHLVEHKSNLLLNKQKVKTTDRVLDRMYGIEFGKKSN